MSRKERACWIAAGVMMASSVLFWAAAIARYGIR